MYIRPRTSRSRGSVAQELSRSVHTRSDVRAATWFISHTFLDTLDAVLQFFQRRHDFASAVVWLDFLVTAQHASAGPSKLSSWWMGTFKQTIARIGSLLLVVDAWDDPAPLKRAWYGVAARVSVCVRARAADVLHLRRCVLELHAFAAKKKEQGVTLRLR
jgi:hypothetical protein